MSVTLSSADLRQVTSAANLLLSPLDAPDTDSWRAGVNRALRPLVNADSAGFLLPAAGLELVYSEEHSPEALAPFPDYLPPPLSDGRPIWTALLHAGVGTIDSVYGGDARSYYRSAYYNEYAAPNGAADTLASAVLLTDTSADAPLLACLQLWRAKVGGERFDERTIAIMSLLQPAFRSGVEMWRRFRNVRPDFLRAVDEIGQACALFDRDGRQVHATPALGQLYLEDEAPGILQTAVTRAATFTAASDPLVSAATEVRTPSARYSVTVSTYEAGRFVIVVVARLTPRRPDLEQLRHRFSLTPAEGNVAIQLAAGKRNSEIATALGVSVHTAKRHTERVLQKLGIRSRAEVSTRLS